MTEKRVKYTGLGFPVYLVNPPVKQTAWGEVLDINHNILSRAVFYVLIDKPSGFTGDQIKFIRHFVEKNQGDFAKWVGVTRTAVNKWESKHGAVIPMTLANQIYLRMQMARYLNLDLNVTITSIEPAARSKHNSPIVVNSLAALAAAKAQGALPHQRRIYA